MKSCLLLLLLSFVAIQVHAQGGIGNQPRKDLVMVGAIERDSLADEIFARITDLKRYAANNQIDSAAQIIAFGKAKDSLRWARTVNPQNPEERARVDNLLKSIQKLNTDFPDVHREYFAIFKDASPGGRLYTYQIHYINGSKKRMVTWHFYGNGDKLMLGDFS